MMELTHARDAQFGFLDEDSRHLVLDPLQPGQRALAITSPDGEGLALIGTVDELQKFAGRLDTWLQRARP